MYGSAGDWPTETAEHVEAYSGTYVPRRPYVELFQKMLLKNTPSRRLYLATMYMLVLYVVELSTRGSTLENREVVCSALLLVLSGLVCYYVVPSPPADG